MNERQKKWQEMHELLTGDECDMLREALDARIEHYEEMFEEGAEEYPDEGEERDFKIVALTSLRKLVAHEHEVIE